MEIFKRKILLESIIDRRAGITYGALSASSISINFFLTQTINDMGLLTDNELFNETIIYPLTIGGIPNINNPLVDKLLDSGITFNFMFSSLPVLPPQQESDFYAQGLRVSATTSSRLSELKKYDLTNPYEEGFIFNAEDYYDYQGNLINGASEIFDISTSNYTGYSFDAQNDTTLGTINQNTGLMFRDLGVNISSNDYELNVIIFAPSAKISYIAQGWNETNISLSANVKEEKFLNIVSPPEVESEVFIERGANSVLESHFRLSEIESLEHLENYNNGAYYKLEKQTL